MPSEDAALHRAAVQHASRPHLIRHVALLGAASLIAGIVVGGVGGRLVMRVSAVAAGNETAGFLTENGNRVGEITVGGTLALIIFVGGLGGMLASIVVVGAEPWLRWAGPLRGLGYGLAVLAAFGPFDSSDFRNIDPSGLNVAMFLGLFLAFGFAADGTYRMLDRRLPPPRHDIQGGYDALALCGLIALFFVVLFFTTPGFCGCEPAHYIGLSVLVMVVSTLIALFATTADVPRTLTRAARVSGYAALFSLLVLGLTRSVDQIRTIL